MQMKTKNKLKQENILECNKALEDGRCTAKHKVMDHKQQIVKHEHQNEKYCSTTFRKT
jgi:hypothetical protein